MRLSYAILGAATCLAGAVPAYAQEQNGEVDTLTEALVEAYWTNPTLTAQRESLGINDAAVAIARAGGRPTLSATVGVDRDLTRQGSLDFGGSLDPSLGATANLTIPVYRGGAVKNDVRAAQVRVESARATLRAVEGDVFVLAVSAYMDVILNRAIVELNRNQVRVLDTNFQASQDRFEIGDLTRTDVAQSQARLQLAASRLAAAEGRLAGAVETYREVIGVMPGELASPPPLPPLPETADEAVRIALVDNPDLLAADLNTRAAAYDVRVARASRTPTLSVVGTGQYVNALGNAGVDGTGSALPNSGSVTSIGISSRVPIYQGGLPSARIAQARAREGQTLEQRVGTERAVVADVRTAFANYEAALLSIEANIVAVEANELALEGARLENSIGSRSVLFVLDAEQELLNAQVDLVTARRDAYVAGFRLLNAMGQAEAEDLNLDGGALYDPLGNYRRVAQRWNDWAGNPRSEVDATSTVTDAERPQGVTDAQ
ncbi:TolC family outer membrane protein [Sphingomicrobium sediminis]|uniref:TolC family outer membrane protein n=1 Tax=Sphingomicrobium sediminis TaxID=2950949 RepID=A0A9X2EIN0_9SPHN|nr:TolC family outer membrane protein [Sphingomicrobium sediminis]MCM8556339.1 TolC family outer membrane protein [Sphingomicrobium sediminis]